MLIGDSDAGMFFHNDHLAAASWQAAVVGKPEGRTKQTNASLLCVSY